MHRIGNRRNLLPGLECIGRLVYDLVLKLVCATGELSMGLLLFLSDDQSIRLHERLTTAIREAITSGQLVPGTLIPSSRELAESMGISRSTVSKAYEELIRTGHLVSRPGGKTWVAASLPGAQPLGRRVVARRSEEIDQYLSTYASRLNVIEINATWGLGISAPPKWLLPIAQWKQLLSKYCNSLDPGHADPHPFGRLSLRTSIAGFLNRTRGLHCRPEQVITFLESESALSYLTLWLIDEGDLVVVEEPGYINARNLFLAHGAEVLSIPVDEEGLDVSALRKKIPEGRKVKMIYVTPTFHDPTGVCMSYQRRKELLDFASEHKTLVVEDNFQGNHIFLKDVPPPLQRLSGEDNVFYISSFWKVLFPLSMVGFLVIPDRFVDLFARAKSISQEASPEIEGTLEEFIEGGHLEKHLKWMMRTLTPLRQNLIEKLLQNFGQSVKIGRQSSAFWLTVQFDQSMDTELIAEKARALGLILQPTRSFYADEEKALGNEFIIPFALDEQQDPNQD